MDNQLCHSGIFKTAKNILVLVKASQVLEKAFDQHPVISVAIRKIKYHNYHLFFYYLNRTISF